MSDVRPRHQRRRRGGTADGPRLSGGSGVRPAVGPALVVVEHAQPAQDDAQHVDDQQQQHQPHRQTRARHLNDRHDEKHTTKTKTHPTSYLGASGSLGPWTPSGGAVDPRWWGRGPPRGVHRPPPSGCGEAGKGLQGKILGDGNNEKRRKWFSPFLIFSFNK